MAWTRRAAMARGCGLIAALLAVAAAASSCADISRKFAETASQSPYIGLPATAPERPPAESQVYPAVHDMPVRRDSLTLTNVEQQKLEEDLVAARDDQQNKVGLSAQKSKKDKQTPQKVVPVTSRASIY